MLAETLTGHLLREIVVRGTRGGPLFPEPHGQLSGLSVSHLLAARNGVAEFTGRDTELAVLRRWRDTATADRAALLVHGPGGQGKTRLTAWFAAETRRLGWRVVAARHVGDGTNAGPSDRSPGDGGLGDAPRGYRSGGGLGSGEVNGATEVAGLLVLVDYAERWPAEDLLSLADDLAVVGGTLVRLLLVARSAGWWAGMRHEFTEHRFRAEQLRLGPLAADVSNRGGLFDEAGSGRSGRAVGLLARP
jgi:hypothetical protein